MCGPTDTASTRQVRPSAHPWPDRCPVGSGVPQADLPVLAVDDEENHHQRDDHGDGQTHGRDQDQKSKTSSITPSEGGCAATYPHAQSFALLVLRSEVCTKPRSFARVCV